MEVNIIGMPLDLNLADATELKKTVESDGWKVLDRVMAGQLMSMVSLSMVPEATEKLRDNCSGSYHTILTYKEDLKEDIDSAIDSIKNAG